MPPRVHVDAAPTDRSLTKGLPQRVEDGPDPVLLLWRRLIDTAVADATKTECGVPTYGAVMARWWIEEHRPAATQGPVWDGSFGRACAWLGIDEAAERARLSGMIQVSLRRAAWEYSQSVAYVRRAEVLACLGRTPVIAKQFVLGLVSVEEYKAIAGINEVEKRPRLFDREHARVDRKRRRAA